jgi:hypothetical protein
MRINQMLTVNSIAVLLLTVSCSQESKPASAGVRVMPAGNQFAGFLSDYARLKPNPNFENTVTYVRDDPAKNIHKYVAVMVEPVAIYVATDDASKAMPDRGRTALANYFRQSIIWAVNEAFPVVTEPGPLVLRLRSALIGVDVGGATGQDQKPGGDALERTVNIGKVGVEMELVDSQTGEQIVAAVDRQTLGENAVIGSANFSRDEKFQEAVRACRGWSLRLREFMDSAEELSEEDVARIEATQVPYGSEPKLP